MITCLKEKLENDELCLLIDELWFSQFTREVVLIVNQTYPKQAYEGFVIL